MRRYSFLDTGHNIRGIIKLCKIARLDSRYTDLFMKSEIKLKKSFLSYLNFCKDRKLIEKVSVKRNNYRNARMVQRYRINEDGHKQLTILVENH